MPEEVSTAIETPQPAEQNPTNWPKMILAVILGLTLLAGAAYAGYWYGTQQTQPAEELSAPTPAPTPKLDYVQGEVLVTFEDNTTYKQAKDLFSSMGISEYSYAGPELGGYSYVGSEKVPEKERVLADDTLLQPIDLFKLKIPPGTEDRVTEKLAQEPIVRSASKNYLSYPQ